MAPTLVIAQPKLRTEDPHNCTDAKDVLSIFSALFDALVAFGPDLRYVPALAASWEVSADARVWTFNLRTDVRFHNGQRVDAEAVRCSLERMARPDMGVTLGAPGVYHQYLEGMRIDILDRSRIRLTTAEPLADLLDILVTGYVLPPETVGQSGSDFQRAPIGTGPYAFLENPAADRIRSKKNGRYFQGEPANSFVEWRRVPGPAERMQALAKGEAHLATGLGPLDIQAQPGVRVDRSRGTTAYIIMFNAARGPLKDPRVRLALNIGIDRQAIVAQVLNGAGYPLHGFISPHHVGADPAGTGFPYDPGRARALLTAAGFKEGLEITLDSPTSLPDEAVLLSEALAAQLRRIGVSVKPHYIEDRALYAQKVRLKEIHDMCVFDSSPLSTYRVLREKIDSRFKGSWWQGYRHAEVEKLIDRARATVDPGRRERVYRHCFRLLQEDPPWLYLYNHQILTGLSPALSAWKLPRHGVVDVYGLPAV